MISKVALSAAVMLTTLVSGTAGTDRTAPATPAWQDAFPFAVEGRTLENGLRMVVVPFDSPGIVSFYLVVRTGSRDEVEPGHSGFAHFFEHMMFRGTERYPAERYNEVLKRLGVDANASTWDDRTVYYMTGPAAAFDEMVEIEADRFQNLRYTADAFRTEALAVLGEYNKSASNPVQALHEKLRETAFTKHTYRHTTLGFLDDIKAMPGYYDYSLSFFDRFYRPDNVIALVVGDVVPERAFDTLERHFGKWKKGYRAPVVATEPPQKSRRVAHIEWPNSTRPYVMLGYRTPAFSSRTVDFAALDVIGELLVSEAAPFYQQVVVKEQWVDFINGGAEDHRDPYLFTILARMKAADAVPKVLAALDTHLDRLRREPVDPARLDRVKQHLRYRFAMGLNTPDAVADTLSHYLGLRAKCSSSRRQYRPAHGHTDGP